MVTNTAEEYKVRQEDSYRVNIDENLSSGESMSLELKDPSGSNKRFIVTSIKITAQGPAQINIPRAADISSGTQASIENKSIGSNNTSAAGAYSGSTYSSANNVQTEYLGSGRGGQAFGGSDSDVTGSVLTDSSLLIEVVNTSNESHNYSITVEFYESSTIPK
jgi:hypothetical protein